MTPVRPPSTRAKSHPETPWLGAGRAIPVLAGILGIPAPDVEGGRNLYSLIFGDRSAVMSSKCATALPAPFVQLRAVQKGHWNTLGIKPGETTTDKPLHLLPICCLGACDRAPWS